MNAKERISKFYDALIDDKFIANNAEEAHAFLKRHLDSVETSELPEELHNNLSIRMSIPGLDLQPTTWVRTGHIQKWEAFKHVVKIWDSGDIEIKTKCGELWFTRCKSR